MTETKTTSILQIKRSLIMNAINARIVLNPYNIDALTGFVNLTFCKELGLADEAKIMKMYALYCITKARTGTNQIESPPYYVKIAAIPEAKLQSFIDMWMMCFGKEL